MSGLIQLILVYQRSASSALTLHQLSLRLSAVIMLMRQTETDFRSVDVGDKTADTADRAGPEFTQLMLIHRKVLKLLQFRTHFDRLLSDFTVVCENVFMSIDEHDIIQSDPFSHFKGTVHLFTCSWIYSSRLFC